MGCLYYFDLKLIELLNLDHEIKYSCNLIFEMLKKKKSNFTNTNYNFEELWFLDNKFLNIIIDKNLYNTTDSFYELIYEKKSHDWRRHYKIGFPRFMINLMIKSLIINENMIMFIKKFSYSDFGKKIDKVII